MGRPALMCLLCMPPTPTPTTDALWLFLHGCRVQVLILSPTRELAQQTEKVILAVGEYMNIQAHACIGGKSLGTCWRCNLAVVGTREAQQARAGGWGLISAGGSCFAGDDIRKLDSGVHAVSGTPGRVFDMIKRKTLRTRDIKTLVLDEADEMLAKNFKDQIYDIYRYLPPETQVCMKHAWLA